MHGNEAKLKYDQIAPRKRFMRFFQRTNGQFDSRGREMPPQEVISVPLHTTSRAIADNVNQEGIVYRT
jgi:hypothetical protein